MGLPIADPNFEWRGSLKAPMNSPAQKSKVPVEALIIAGIILGSWIVGAIALTGV